MRIYLILICRSPLDRQQYASPMLQPRFDKLDCAVRVITPENIAFEYELAGPFQRLPAFAFDISIRIAVFVALMIVLTFALSWLALGGLVVAVTGFLMFFLFSWFYGIYFETRFNGRTIGKMVFRLRVISVDGRPINGVQAALRNLLRPADMAVPLSLQVLGPDAAPASIIPTLLVGLTCMLVTRRSQRIGDLAAGTMVISEHRKRSAFNLQPDDLRAFGLAELIPANFPISSSLAQTTALYMENRRRLSPPRREEIARHLAEPLIERLELLPDTSPDLLLCALYVRIFLSEEQQQQGQARLRSLVQVARVPPPIASAYRPTTSAAMPPPAMPQPKPSGDIESASEAKDGHG